MRVDVTGKKSSLLAFIKAALPSHSAIVSSLELLNEFHVVLGIHVAAAWRNGGREVWGIWRVNLKTPVVFLLQPELKPQTPAVSRSDPDHPAGAHRYSIRQNCRRRTRHWLTWRISELVANDACRVAGRLKMFYTLVLRDSCMNSKLCTDQWTHSTNTSIRCLALHTLISWTQLILPTTWCFLALKEVKS